MCSGGIQASGSRPSSSRVRSQRASAKSVLARRLGPRRARVIGDLGQVADGAGATEGLVGRTSQPVPASTATWTSHCGKRPTQSTTAAGVAAIRPRIVSPVCAIEGIESDLAAVQVECWRDYQIDMRPPSSS